MSSARGAAPRKQMSFHFINAHPSSETERSRSRYFIRSHIGTWTWQQSQQNSGGPETDDVDESHAQNINHSMHRVDRNSIEVEAATSTSCSPSLSISSQTPHWATGKTIPGSHDGSGWGLTTTDTNRALDQSASGLSGSLYSMDYISAGTLDPFQTYPSSFPPEFVNKCITYG